LQCAHALILYFYYYSKSKKYLLLRWTKSGEKATNFKIFGSLHLFLSFTLINISVFHASTTQNFASFINTISMVSYLILPHFNVTINYQNVSIFEDFQEHSFKRKRGRKPKISHEPRTQLGAEVKAFCQR
jgi:hypothetical protein